HPPGRGEHREDPPRAAMDSHFHGRAGFASNVSMAERNLEVNPRVIAGVQEPPEAVARTNEHPRVLCVAPAWNEGERIARVVRAVPRDLVETIVVVDGGSTDDTADHAESSGATVIRSGANRGVGAAIRSGIDYAIEHGYDIVVVVSGGGKTPPEQIPRLLDPIIRGDV